MMFMFIRVLPVISVFELRELVNLTKSRKHMPGDDGGNGHGHGHVVAASGAAGAAAQNYADGTRP
jgi:hypothetical protein